MDVFHSQKFTLMAPSDSSFEKNHLPHFIEAVGFQTVEIDAAGEPAGVEFHRMTPAGKVIRQDSLNHLTPDIVNRNFNPGTLRQAEIYGGAGVEGVGVILVEDKFTRRSR